MKYIQSKFILCSMLVTAPGLTHAQTPDEEGIDSLVRKESPEVQVAFRKMAQKDLLGGVSVVNV